MRLLTQAPTPTRDNQILTIVESVSDQMGVNIAHVVATRVQRGRRYRLGVVVQARHASMWLVRHILKASFHEVARFFHCDHSTVVYACQRIDAGNVPALASASIDAVMFGEHPRWASA